MSEAIRATGRLEMRTPDRPSGRTSFVVEIPSEFIDAFGAPSELDLRLLRNDEGCVITISAANGKGLYSASEAFGGGS
ncbi:MAG: hypothetical protein JRN43_06820 [Nitrososphaerota archaeon]|nr:hypothetical protein [Nitrososphaerota archaeon]